jgi:uncharacterized phage-associated protein
MTYSVKAVANSLINRALIDGQDLTHLKLQKLIYYVSGYYLAAKDAPLIDYGFEAWDYGPVVSSLYYDFRKYGNESISLATDYDWDSGAETPTPPVMGDAIFDKILEFVWKNYGHYSAAQLSQMTHETGSPWDKTKKNNSEIKNAVISLDTLKEYFSGFVKRNIKHA